VYKEIKKRSSPNIAESLPERTGLQLENVNQG
jgi:hypothetical protein